MEPAQAVRGFLDALGVPPERIPPTLDAQTALYRSLLAGRRVLVILDNARDAEQVRPLLPGTSAALVVVTSRHQLTPLIATEGAEPLTLDVLSNSEARELLSRRLSTVRVGAEPEAVDAIITACARLPLALAVAAARTRQTRFPLATLAEELGGPGNRLDVLDAGDPASQVRAVFSWSYDALTRPAARLFRLLGLQPGPDISVAAAASLAARPREETRRLLTELARANLLVEHVPGRYTLHDLLRAYAAELARTHDSDDQRHAAITRLLDHYLHTASAADRLLDPGRDAITLTAPQPGVTAERPADDQQALNWLTAEYPVLMAAVAHAATTGFDTHTWQLAWVLVTFFSRQGHWHDQAAAGRAALAAARRLADPIAQALAHRQLAQAYTLLDRADDANSQLTQALDLFRCAGDRIGQARTHVRLGVLLERRGLLSPGLQHARQAFDLFQAAGHRHGQADALSNVGWYYALLGDYQEALSACQRALTLHRELDDRVGQAHTLDSLGYAYHHLGHHTKALTCYQQAFTLFRAFDDRYYQANTLIHLGDAHRAAGDPQAARGAWRGALAILGELNHPDADRVRVQLR
jgi:tetratricopeptide (TPR) repeat protein